jgi:hypothetical protein
MFDLMFSSKSKTQKSANKSAGKSNSKKDKENLIMDAAAREVTKNSLKTLTNLF